MSSAKPAPSARRLRGVLVVVTCAACALLAVALTAIGATARAAGTRAVAHASSGTPAFSHPVIVDEQWPGFEPDLAPSANGTIYTSTPQGFVGTISPVWSSRDSGSTYQMVPGNVFSGKQATCVGGGDTDLYTDPGNQLYFSDLQGLTNISISSSADGGAHWSTNCAGAPNTPDDRMWFAGAGSLAQHNLVLFNDYDSAATGVDPAGPGSNQLVESVSTDGTTFKPVMNANPAGLAGDCAGAAVQDCVTDNEGISGNQVVDQFHANTSSANVYIAHTTSVAETGVRIAEGHVDLTGTVPSATWTESPNLAGPLCPTSVKTADGSLSCEDSSGNPIASIGENFASIAQDSSGYLYVTFTYAPEKASGASNPVTGPTVTQTGPEQIYVVHSLEPAPADPAKITWSAPQLITGAGISTGTNTFPWIAAGSNGRVDVAYYHSDSTSQDGKFGASNLTKASWSVQMAQSLDALDANPTYTTTDVSEGPVKYGQICTNGVGCSAGGDRSLGDFLQVKLDTAGGALVSYVYDTSAASTAASAIGPEAVSRQLSGPSLYASVGDVSQGNGPGLAMGSVSDPTGDANYSHGGARVEASSNLDLTGASLANGTTSTGAKALVATIKVKSLATLVTPSTEGGPDGSWMMRWDLVTPGVVGNGHIFYVGMDNNQGTGTAGSSPTFFTGDQNTVAKEPALLTYPQTTLLPHADASYDAATGTITIKVPLSDVGNPAAGTVLHSVTAFTATSSLQQSSQTEFNQIDATAPFDLVVGAPGTVGQLAAPPSSRHTLPARCPAATGGLNARHLGPLALGMTRAQAQAHLSRYATHGRQDMDFYCVRGGAERVAYAYPRELRQLHVPVRPYNGRAVLLLSANRRYGFDHQRVGSRVHLSRGAHPIVVTVGANRWYVVRRGTLTGVLKVHGGRVQEIGILTRRLVMNRAAARRFFGGLI